LIAHRVTTPSMEAAERFFGNAARIPWLVGRIGFMFAFTCYGWLLFRATSFQQIADMTAALLNPTYKLPIESLRVVLTLCAPLLLVQLLQYNTGRLEFLRERWLPLWARVIVYSILLYCVLFLGAVPQAFVYFQF